MTTEVESNCVVNAGPAHRKSRSIETRTWCFDCYDRRDPWVLNVLGGLGVEFRHVVLEDKDVCRSCKTPLPMGLHAMAVTIPLAPPIYAVTDEARP